MKKTALALCFCASSLTLIGCGGGNDGVVIPTSTPRPTLTATPTATPHEVALAGSYVGTFTATYNPNSPLSGTINGTLQFVVHAGGTVTVSNPVSSDPSGDGTGTLAGNQISAFGTNIQSGLGTLSGTLIGTGSTTTGSGTLTVANQTETAFGTWQAQKQ